MFLQKAIAYTLLIVLIQLFLDRIEATCNSSSVTIYKRIENQNRDIELDVNFLNADKNETLYCILIRASKIVYSEFRTTFITHPKFGPYVESIGDLYENRELNKYWMIYQKNGTECQPLAQGISTTYISNGDQYLFWYMSLVLEKI